MNTQNPKLYSNGRELWNKSCVPKRHKLKKEFPAHQEWNIAYQKLLNMDEQLFIVCGNRGTGKTQMAVSFLREWCKQGKTCIYTKAFSLFTDLRSAYNNSQANILGFYFNPELLIIDALEERGETPFENRAFNNLIDHRYDEMLSTVMITNQHKAELQETFGTSIIQRVQETGTVVECNWESFRTSNA